MRYIRKELKEDKYNSPIIKIGDGSNGKKMLRRYIKKAVKKVWNTLERRING